MFKLPDPTQVQETCVTTSRPIVEKHRVRPLLQINRISEMLKCSIERVFLPTPNMKTKAISRTALCETTALSYR
jgi:hypothetical protein